MPLAKLICSNEASAHVVHDSPIYDYNHLQHFEELLEFGIFLRDGKNRRVAARIMAEYPDLPG